MFFGQNDYILKITGVYHIIRSRSQHVTPPRDVCVLSYRLKGTAHFYRNGAVWTADPTALLFLPPKIAYRQDSTGEELIAVHMNITDLREREIETVLLQKPEAAAACFRTMQTAWETGQYYRCCSALYALLADVCKSHPYPDGRAAASPLDPALAAIRVEYGDPQLSVPELANRCGLSEAHFRRLFRLSYPMPPLQYLTHFRIAKAKNMLMNGSTIAETAYHCGFRDPKYFSTVFHATVGCTPSQWKTEGSRG